MQTPETSTIDFHPEQSSSTLKRLAARGLISLSLMTGIGLTIEAGGQVLKPNKTPIASAESVTDCGYVLLKGSDWLGGNGVDVHSNGIYQTSGRDSCAGDEVHDLNANPPIYGLGWQCVELVDRLYATKGWGDHIWVGDGGAKALYTKAANGDWSDQGISAHSNGSNYTPAPGDMIVFDGSLSNQYGHVSIFDHFDPSDGNKIWAVEQNNKDSAQNYTSWVTYNWDPTTGTISKSGSTISGFVHSSHNTLTNGMTSSIPNSSVAFNSLGEGAEFKTPDGWAYVKRAGVAWVINNVNNWNDINRQNWGNPPTTVLAVDDVHNHEVGWDGDHSSPGAHPPGDGAILYEAGSTQQYKMMNGAALPLESGELSDLNAVGQAVKIPADGRLDYFRNNVPYTLPSDFEYRIAGTPDVRLVELTNGDWKGFSVGNSFLLDCLRLTRGLNPVVLPASAVNRAGVVPTSESAACQFRPNMVFTEPGGNQWQITGDNSSENYARHLYHSPLAVYLNTNGAPDYQSLRGNIQEIAPGPDIDMPNGIFFGNLANGDVFEHVNNMNLKALSPDTLKCSGGPNVIWLPGSVMDGLPQDGPLQCTFENRIIYGPDGAQFYIQNGAAERIYNGYMSNCIKVRRGIPDPIPVSWDTLNQYNQGRSAYCPWGLESGLNFVRNPDNGAIYKILPNGYLLHAGGLCSNYSSAKQTNFYDVPSQEFDGSIVTGDWWPSSQECANLTSVYQAVGG